MKSGIEWRHVHSHIGQPWNEMADAFAAAAAQGVEAAVLPCWEQLVHVINDPIATEWAWLAQASDEYLQALPLTTFSSLP